jgi:hypothetical protein
MAVPAVDGPRPRLYGHDVAKKSSKSTRASKPTKTTEPDLIGDAIRAEVERQGMSVYTIMQMVAEAGVSRGTVYSFLKQKRPITTANASAIFEVLQLSITPKSDAL